MSDFMKSVLVGAFKRWVWIFNELCNKSCSLRGDYGWLKREARVEHDFKCIFGIVCRSLDLSVNAIMYVYTLDCIEGYVVLCKTRLNFVSSHFRLCTKGKTSCELFNSKN